MDAETRGPRALWAVFNLGTGEILDRFGRHGSTASAQMMLEEFLDSFDMEVRAVLSSGNRYHQRRTSNPHSTVHSGDRLHLNQAGMRTGSLRQTRCTLVARQYVGVPILF